MDLHLQDPRELFVVGDFDPFAPERTTRSGIEQIRAAARAMKQPEQISVTLYLPADHSADHIDEATRDAIHAALTRYCAYHEEEAQASMASLKREAIGELKVGSVVFGACLVLALFLLPLLTASNHVSELLGAALTGALVIALWVVVWAPIETFFVDPLPYAWERRFLRRVQAMELVIRAEPA
jgi:hypothetical protein